MLSKVLGSDKGLQETTVVKHEIGSRKIVEMMQQTVVEMEEKKAEDKKMEEAVSAAS